MTTPDTPGGEVPEAQPVRVARTVGSYGVQLVITALTSFVRVPLMVRALGQDSFGLVIVVTSGAPLLLAMCGGGRLASRTLASESWERGHQPPLRALTQLAMRFALAQSALVLLVAAAPLTYSLLQADGVVGRVEFGAAIAVAGVLCSVACVGGIGWGVLEAQGRAVLLNGFGSAVAVFGLLVNWALWRLDAGFFAFATVNTVTSAAPFYLGFTVPAFRAALRRTASTASSATISRQHRALLIQGWAQNAAPFSTRAADPAIVSSATGPADAATLGVAQRLGMLLTVVPLALEPFVSARVARRRPGSNPMGLREAGRLALAYGAVAMIAGLGLVAVGPALARALAEGEFGADRGLFLMIGVAGVLSSMGSVLLAIGTGPVAMRQGTRIDMVCAGLNLVASIWLAHLIGMVGPVVASIGANVLAIAGRLRVLVRSPEALRETHMVAAVDQEPL